MKKISILIITVLFFSCGTKKQPMIKNIYWVNSSKVDCVGVAPTTCLQIQRGESIKQNSWELFYSTIENFEYQPGYVYKLNIKEENIDNPPADASSIKYTLIEVLEKKKDNRLDVHDIWILDSLISSDSLVINNFDKTPQIEINVTKMRISGTNGCNNISGSIKTLNDSVIEFNPMMETSMACPDMDIPRLFSLVLSETKSYKKIENKLVFFNKEGIKTLVFKKSD